MSTEAIIKCNLIIHTASAAAGAVGAGLAQIPVSDTLIIKPVQLAMTISLGQVFGIELSQSAAESAAGSAAATMIGKAACNLILGWIPIVGNVINATVAAALTEGMGWILAEQFAMQSNCA